MLMENILGKKGLIWLEAFRRFLRKENSWNFKKVFRVRARNFSVNAHTVLGELRTLGLNVFDGPELIANNERPVFYYPTNKTGEFDIVAVRLDNIISLDKIGVWEYDLIIKEARKLGFDTLSRDAAFTLGLQAAARMVRLQPEEDYHGHQYLICSDPMLIPETGSGEKVARLPYVSAKGRNRVSGLVTLFSVGLPKTGPHHDKQPHPLKNPETILIFGWSD